MRGSVRVLTFCAVFFLTYAAVALALARVGMELSRVLLVGGAAAAVAVVLAYFLSKGYGNES